VAPSHRAKEGPNRRKRYRITELVGTARVSGKDAVKSGGGDRLDFVRDCPPSPTSSDGRQDRRRQESCFRARVALSFKYES